MNETLEPCPFCGSTNTDPKEWMAGDGSQGPGCENCGATARSVEEWNAAGRRAARLAALELSAWDVHEAISDALDSPEDANERTIRRVLDEMGELLPAHRPADSATRQESDAHG